MTTRAPIALALDAPDLATMRHWVNAVSPHVSTLKLGLEGFYRDGSAAVEVARDSGCDFFLDLKLHDIPNTVAGAARSVAKYQPQFLTVHASGGSDMIRAAVETLPDTRITAVTILTSLDDQELRNLGFAGTSAESVIALSLIAVEAGARAIVCSPHEVASVRAVVPPDITLITPGVRPRSADSDDQRRVSTPEQALADGADIVVIGRPITGATEPGAAALEIAREITAGTGT